MFVFSRGRRANHSIATKIPHSPALVTRDAPVGEQAAEIVGAGAWGRRTTLTSRTSGADVRLGHPHRHARCKAERPYSSSAFTTHLRRS